jgi:hypothetical protein
MTARRRFEIQSHGVDEFHQGIGTDPFGSQSWLGLRVPFLPTIELATPPEPPWAKRYLFQGAAFSVAEGSRARLIGYRQLLTLGVVVPNGEGFAIPVELEVTSPQFSFVDATTSWHFRRLGPPNAQGLPSFRPSNTTDLENARKGLSMTPALLYDTLTVPAGDPYYTHLTAYSPPNAGRPYGSPLTDNPELSDVYGLQTKWRTARAWESLDMEVEGPDTICAFISTAQTEAALSQGLAELAPGLSAALPPETNFIMTANNGFGVPVFIWRVGVSLIVEVDSLVSEIRASGEP